MSSIAASSLSARDARAADQMTFEKSKAQIARASQLLAGGVSSNFRLGMSPTPLVFDRAEGAVPVRSRWQPADRLLPRHGADDPRPYPAGGRRGRLAAAGARHPVWRPEPDRSRGRRALLQTGALRRDGCASAAQARRRCSSRCAWRAPRPGATVSSSSRVTITAGSTICSSRLVPRRTRLGPSSAEPQSRAARARMLCLAELQVLSWNDLAAVEERLARRCRSSDHGAGDVQCRRNTPGAGYLEGVRALAAKHGAILIFDEVITGFRVAPGGAQGLFGVTPDLATFGKCLANGFPGRGDRRPRRSSRHVRQRRRRPWRHIQQPASRHRRHAGDFAGASRRVGHRIARAERRTSHGGVPRQLLPMRGCRRS